MGKVKEFVDRTDRLLYTYSLKRQSGREVMVYVIDTLPEGNSWEREDYTPRGGRPPFKLVTDRERVT